MTPMRLLILLLCLLPMFAEASGIRVVLTPKSHEIGDVQCSAFIERLPQPSKVYRVRIIVAKAAGVLPLHAVSLLVGDAAAPKLATDLVATLGRSPTVEASFEISEEFLSQATVSAHYANYSKSTAFELYEFKLNDWMNQPDDVP